MATRFYDPRVQPTDSNGNPYPAGRMYFYTVLTTTPITAYSALTPQNSSTSLGSYIVADGNGVFPESYLAVNNYRVILKDVNGVIVDDYNVYTPSSAVGAGEIGTTELEDSSVTNAKLAGSIAGSKLVNATITATQLASSAVTTDKIDDLAVTVGKLAGSITGAKIASTTITGSNLVNETVTATQLATNAVTTVKITDANITPAKLSGAQTGSAPIFGVRAWAYGLGTATFTPNTTAGSAGGNVTTVTRTGAGQFSVEMTTAMPDTNYAVVSGGGGVTGSTVIWNFAIGSKTTQTFTMSYTDSSFAATDPTHLSFIVIR